MRPSAGPPGGASVEEARARPRRRRRPRRRPRVARDRARRTRRSTRRRSAVRRVAWNGASVACSSTLAAGAEGAFTVFHRSSAFVDRRRPEVLARNRPRRRSLDAPNGTDDESTFPSRRAGSYRRSAPRRHRAMRRAGTRSLPPPDVVPRSPRARRRPPRPRRRRAAAPRRLLARRRRRRSRRSHADAPDLLPQPPDAGLAAVFAPDSARLLRPGRASARACVLAPAPALAIPQTSECAFSNLLARQRLQRQGPDGSVLHQGLSEARQLLGRQPLRRDALRRGPHRGELHGRGPHEREHRAVQPHGDGLHGREPQRGSRLRSEHGRLGRHLGSSWTRHRAQAAASKRTPRAMTDAPRGTRQ